MSEITAATHDTAIPATPAPRRTMTLGKGRFGALVNHQSVYEAIEAIKAKGEYPSRRAVQTHLGGGSLATIQKFYTQVMAQIPSVPADMDEDMKPVNEAIKIFAQNLYSKVKAQLEAEGKSLESDVAFYAQNLAVAESRLDEAERLIVERDESIMGLEATIKSAKETIAENKDETRDLRNELAQLRNRAMDLEDARKEVARLLTKVGHQDGTIEERQNDIERLAKELADAKTVISEQAAKIERLDGERTRGGVVNAKSAQATAADENRAKTKTKAKTRL